MGLVVLVVLVVWALETNGFCSLMLRVMAMDLENCDLRKVTPFGNLSVLP